MKHARLHDLCTMSCGGVSRRAWMRGCGPHGQLNSGLRSRTRASSAIAMNTNRLQGDIWPLTVNPSGVGVDVGSLGVTDRVGVHFCVGLSVRLAVGAAAVIVGVGLAGLRVGVIVGVAARTRSPGELPKLSPITTRLLPPIEVSRASTSYSPCSAMSQTTIGFNAPPTELYAKHDSTFPSYGLPGK